MLATTPQADKVSQINFAISRLEKVILDSLDFTQVVQKVVDSIFYELNYLDLGYRIVVLALKDTDKKVLKRVSISRTTKAETAISALPFNYDNLDIPLDAAENYCIKAMLEKKLLITHDWVDILTPPLEPAQSTQVQEKTEIKTSMVYPLLVHDEPIGIMIFSMVKNESEVLLEEKELLLRFTDIAALAVQNSQLYARLEGTSRDLEKANEQLKVLDKRKDEFVSVASHELRTPMTAIKSYLWLALAGKGGPISDKQKHYLTRAYDSTERLIRLVNNLLNLSRIESGRIVLEKTKIEINKLVEDAISEVKPRADELRISLTVLLLPLSVWVEVDVDRIKEIIINLVGNALKFTPEGGKVTLTLEEKNSEVVIRVRDSGVGLTPEDMAQLFQKFGLVAGSYTTNLMAAQGTGLGLYISKSIVEMHGGRIWVESEGKGLGATFSFTLPVCPENAVPE